MNDFNYSGDEEISIGIWILLLIGLAIPVVNIILMLVIAFQKNNRTLSNFGKAGLILCIIGMLFASMQFL